MIRVRAAVLSILFALTIAQLIPFVQNASGDNSDIRLGFSIDRQVWDMGETINFSASATNAGADNASFSCGYVTSFFYFAIADSNGTVHYDNSHPTVVLPMFSHLTIGPGETVNHNFSWEQVDHYGNPLNLTGFFTIFIMFGEPSNYSATGLIEIAIIDDHPLKGPIADFEISYNNPSQTRNVKIDASKSKDSFNTSKSLLFRWNLFSDGGWQDVSWSKNPIIIYELPPSNEEVLLNVEMQVKDPFGQVDEASRIFYIDMAPPEIRINSSLDEKTFPKDSVILINWTASDNRNHWTDEEYGIREIGIWVDNTTHFTYGGNATTSITLSNLSVGEHSVSVSVYDNAGNVGQDMVNFTVQADSSYGWDLIALILIASFAVIFTAAAILCRRRR